MEVKRRQYYLNSNDGSQINSDTSWVTFDFSGVPLRANVDEYITLQISQASIPASWYNVNSTNNYLYMYTYSSGLTYNNNTEYPSIIIALTKGNYTSSTLPTMIQALVRAATNNAGNNTHLSDFTITENTDQNTWTFTSTGNFGIQMSSTCLSLLGIKKSGLVDDATLISSTYTLTSNKIYDLSYTKNVFIVSNSFYNTNVDSNPMNLSSNILASVQANVNFPDIIFDHDLHETVIKAPVISMFEIQLQDDNRNVLGLNNIDWCFTMTARVYKRTDAVDEEGHIWELENDHRRVKRSKNFNHSK